MLLHRAHAQPPQRTLTNPLPCNRSPVDRSARASSKRALVPPMSPSKSAALLLDTLLVMLLGAVEFCRCTDPLGPEAHGLLTSVCSCDTYNPWKYLFFTAFGVQVVSRGACKRRCTALDRCTATAS